MRTADFNYHLPPDLIAQKPLHQRDLSRLLVLNRSLRNFSHHHFSEFPRFFSNGDLLVINNSKVVPARLRALKPSTGAKIEIFLVEQLNSNDWWCLLKPGKRVDIGTQLLLLDKPKQPTHIAATVQEKNAAGHYRLAFSSPAPLLQELSRIGEVPLPPYIARDQTGPGPEDLERYQTVFAKTDGSVAAPTAGLHFTPKILDEIRAQGAEIAEITLHVGLGTFAPVKTESLEDHQMHQERYVLSTEAADAIQRAKSSGKKVFAAGTTSLRVLETVARERGKVEACEGSTRLFLYPPAEFKVVDALLTNFHLPESTLLMLVSAFAAPGSTTGRDLIMDAYAAAIRERYRFFSYGDAMLIL
ncbi:MAG: tRNA preQ1(34) S-adenosylmethionine ribosyltransferase-isomerase QueA [Verrucomicrobiota bacterium]